MSSSPPRRLVAVLLATAVLAAGCSLQQPDDAAGTGPTPSATSTEPTPTPRPIGVETPASELEVGQCFNRYEILDETTKQITLLATNVGCDGPHFGEVYTLVDHPDVAGAPYPGNLVVDAWAQEQCYLLFEDFVGKPYELSVFEIGTFRPSEEQWITGPYRTVHCYVFRPDDETVGSAAELEI